MKRANYLPAPHFFNLNMACRALTEAFGHCVFLVGSSVERCDYRDVDVRCILDDADFDRLFGGKRGCTSGYHPLWSMMCSSISLYLSQHAGLPVDFQIQRRTQANAEYPDAPRRPLGIFLMEPPA